MSADERRKAILRELEGADAPLAAATLGERLGVSRQIVVGDVALLRASGHAVHATNRGYVLNRPRPRRRRSVLVRHAPDRTAAEIGAVLDAGASVVDMSVNHRFYGRITVDLVIRDQAGLAAHLERLPESTTLPELTDGWHTHTLEADTEEQLDAAENALDELGLLRRER